MNVNTAMSLFILIVGLIVTFFMVRFFANTFSGKGNFINDSLTGIISKLRGKDASLGTSIKDAMDEIFPDKNMIKPADSNLTKKAKSCLLELNSSAGKTISPWCNFLDVKRRMAELK